VTSSIQSLVVTFRWCCVRVKASEIASVGFDHRFIYWAIPPLIMGDDGRERHAVGDRLKKLTANIENGSCPSWIIGTNGIGYCCLQFRIREKVTPRYLPTCTDG
jgi:hypothetical protein